MAVLKIFRYSLRLFWSSNAWANLASLSLYSWFNSISLAFPIDLIIHIDYYSASLLCWSSRDSMMFDFYRNSMLSISPINYTSPSAPMFPWVASIGTNLSFSVPTLIASLFLLFLLVIFSEFWWELLLVVVMVVILYAQESYYIKWIIQKNIIGFPFM